MGMLILSCFLLGFLFVHFNKFNMYEFTIAYGKYMERALQTEKGKVLSLPLESTPPLHIT